MDWYFLVERHLDPMTEIAAGLGDDLINARPDLPGANSAYQLVVHCCVMTEWWVRSAILGEAVTRDRDAEFVATGTVADMRSRVEALKSWLPAALGQIDPAAPLGGDPSAHYVGTPIGDTAGGVLLHVLEELAQHHGHLEITRDVVVRSRA